MKHYCAIVASFLPKLVFVCRNASAALRLCDGEEPWAMVDDLGVPEAERTDMQGSVTCPQCLRYLRCGEGDQ